MKENNQAFLRVSFYKIATFVKKASYYMTEGMKSIVRDSIGEVRVVRNSAGKTPFVI